MLLQGGIAILGRRLLTFVPGMNIQPRPAEGDDGALAGIGLRMAGPEGNFFLHKPDEILHFAVHVLHTFPHLENDGDSGDIDAEIASQVQDELQALQVLFRVEASVALSTRGLEQAFPLVKPQGLGMNAIHLRYSGDHVSATGFAFSSHRAISVEVPRTLKCPLRSKIVLPISSGSQ
jgi:hypothetical protein